MPRLYSSLLLSLLIASSASAVTMAWTPIGNPGNACDPQSQGCFGAVGYGYNIGTYEVTSAQYTEFLNAKAAADPLGLYNTNMGSGYGGITQSGSSGSYSYNVIDGRGDMPVNFVSWYDVVRFANWMNNGQGSGDTETGAYTLLGGTATPSNGTTVTRNEGAAIFLASENEWYKAAYYDGSSASYFDYPTSSNSPTTCSAPTAALNRANCGFAVGDLTAVGSYVGSASLFGTFDQGGNVMEWNDLRYQEFPSPGAPVYRGIRGGDFRRNANDLAASAGSVTTAAVETETFGFRLAMIPEPGTGLLVIAGLVGLAGWRRHGR